VDSVSAVEVAFAQVDVGREHLLEAASALKSGEASGGVDVHVSPVDTRSPVQPQQQQTTAAT